MPSAPIPLTPRAMGWLKLGARSATTTAKAFEEDLKYTTKHIETVSVDPATSAVSELFPIISRDIPDEGLPFIPAEQVKKRNSVNNGGLFIVVDNIVYDCSEFLKEHPGGEQIIRSFSGAECSWQFWRFHSKKEMEEFGKPLRVGRTDGMINEFKEPQKYVGLRKLGGGDWD